MGTYEKLLAMARSDMTFSQKLYKLLSDRKYNTYPYHKIELGNNMSSINYGYCESETTRYLLDHNIKEAYEVIDFEGHLVFLENKARAFPPTIIRRFIDGLALFEWNTAEDGRAYEDADGYGIEHSNPDFLYGVINKSLEIVVPFGKIDPMRLDAYRKNPHELVTNHTHL